MKKAIILFLFLSVSVNAFSIRPEYLSNFGGVNEIHASSVIEGKDLKASVGIQLWVDENFSQRYNNLTIFFRPWERQNGLPAEDLSFEACFGSLTGGYNYDEVPMSCDELISVSNKSKPRSEYLPDYRIYDLTLKIPEFNEEDRSIAVRINYTIPNFIIEQGEYDVIWLKYPGMEGYKITNYVVLPLNTSIPYRFPEDAEISRDYRGRWVFTLGGNKDRFIWYTDAEELRTKEFNFWFWGAALSALFGIIGSIVITLVIKPKVERYLEKQRILMNDVYPALHKEIKEKLEAISKFDGGLGTKRCSELHEERNKLVDSGKYDMIPTKKYFIFSNTLKTKIDEFYKDCEGFGDTLSNAARSVYDILKREFENRSISGVSESEISLVIFYERFLRKEMENLPQPNEKQSIVFMSQRAIPELKLANNDLTDKSFTYDELLEDIHNKVKESELYVQFREKFEDMKKYEELLSELKR